MNRKRHKKHEKKQLVPKLRFPEFRDSETWICKSLKEILIFTDRKVKKPNKPYTRLGIRSHGKGTFLVFNELPEKNAMDYLYEVKLNDLIVNITFAWEGAIAIVSKNDEGALVSHRFPTYVFNESEAIPDFFQYLIIEKYFIYKLGVISPGGAGRNRVLSKTDFLKLKVNIPKIPEQQKIADCLTSLDELITAEAGKLEAYKSHKKGLMQKLFPAKGETVPELQFTEFRGKGEWEEKEVGEVFNVTRGYVLSMNLVKEEWTEEAPYPVFSSQTKNNGLAGFYKDFLYENAITWTTDGANAGDVNYRSGKFYCTNVCGVLINTDGYANPFTAALINSVSKNHVSYVGNPKLMNGVMIKIVVPFPSIKEQQKIADCLSSLDGLITAQNQKIDALKTHKKGLMQGLFPSADEVSV